MRRHRCFPRACAKAPSQRSARRRSTQPLYLGHPLVQAAVAASRDMPATRGRGRDPPDGAAEELAALCRPARAPAARQAVVRWLREGRAAGAGALSSESGERAPPQDRAEAAAAHRCATAPRRWPSNVDEDALHDAERGEAVRAPGRGGCGRAEALRARVAAGRPLHRGSARSSCGAGGSGLEERLEQAQARRDGATGSEARTEAERALLSAGNAAWPKLDGAIAPAREPRRRRPSSNTSSTSTGAATRRRVSSACSIWTW